LISFKPAGQIDLWPILAVAQDKPVSGHIPVWPSQSPATATATTLTAAQHLITGMHGTIFNTVLF
jgi:hypothetical protein